MSTAAVLLALKDNQTKKARQSTTTGPRRDEFRMQLETLSRDLSPTSMLLLCRCAAMQYRHVLLYHLIDTKWLRVTADVYGTTIIRTVYGGGTYHMTTVTLTLCCNPVKPM